MALTLTPDERSELQRRVRSRKIRAEDARRAQVILMLANGEAFTAITATLGVLSGLHQSLEAAVQR